MIRIIILDEFVVGYGLTMLKIRNLPEVYVMEEIYAVISQ